MLSRSTKTLLVILLFFSTTTTVMRPIEERAMGNDWPRPRPLNAMLKY